MKRKDDFVTNSSSTSFIVGNLSKEQTLGVKINIEVDLMNYVEMSVDNLKDLDKYLYEQSGEEPEQCPWRDDCKEIIEAGGVVHFIEVSDDSGDSIESMLYQNGIEDLKLPSNLRVIQGEGGY